jgi:hypothetical protein
MSIEMQKAFRLIRTHNTAKHVADWLAWHHNDATRRCDPSIATLCDETCLSDRAVQQAIRQLENEGHISVIRTIGQRSHYLLHPRTTFTTEGDSPPNDVHPTPERRSPLPPKEIRGTPERRSHEREVKVTSKGKEPESLASAAANAGEADSLFPIEPPQPKPPKERKPKPKPETAADPRHSQITSRIGAAFSEVMEVPFIFSTRFAKELATFLKQYPGTADEFLAMYQQMLKAGRMPYANATKKAADPCFLARNWNACVVELENIAGQYHSQPKKR